MPRTSPDREAYEDPGVVAEYASAGELQPPEQAILGVLDAELADARVLDIGVGGGRTTGHLAGRVREYVGLDYSHGMVEACRERFPDLRFLVGDVRELHDLEDDRFDVVLFSFNGIDELTPADRRQAFAEMHRVVRPGGQVAFSTYNLQTLDHARLAVRRQLSYNPARLARNLVKWARLRFVYNRHVYGGRLDGLTATVIRDYIYGRFLPTHYVRPDEQVAQLRTGYTDVRVFALDGSELDLQELGGVTDHWLYYLATAV